jgi:hypothetical protein
MAYWLFAALCAFAILVMYGVADQGLLVGALLLASPLLLLGLSRQLVRAVFSQDSALRFSQVAAMAAAGALLLVYLRVGYY